MSNPVKDFEHALLVDRVAARFATEFPTDEALKKYLKEHPDADRSKHSVKKKEDDKKEDDKKEDDTPSSDVSQDILDSPRSSDARKKAIREYADYFTSEDVAEQREEAYRAGYDHPSGTKERDNIDKLDMFLEQVEDHQAADRSAQRGKRR